MTTRRHPVKTGVWDVFKQANPSVRVRVPGHTAHEAWSNARTQLDGVGFAECETELVADDWKEPTVTA